MEILGYIGLSITLGYLYFCLFRINWLKEKIRQWSEREKKVVEILYYEIVA